MRIKHILEPLGTKNIIALFALAILVATTMRTPVNKLVDKVIPEKTVKITVVDSERTGNEVWVFDGTNEKSLFQDCKNGITGGVWEYRDGQEFGYGSNMLVSYGDNIGSTITFTTKASLDRYLMFWKNGLGGTISIEVGGKQILLDLYSEAAGGELYKQYPFENELESLALRIAVYIPIILACFILLIWFSYLMIREGKTVPRWAVKPVKKYWFPILWLVLYVLAVIQYESGALPHFLEYGDAVYYWAVNLLPGGKWDPQAVTATVASWRGYMSNLFPTIANLVGGQIAIDPVLIYFIFSTATYAWLITYVLPGLYKELTGIEGTVSQMFASLAVMLFFWNGFLTVVLSDGYGAVAFLSGVLFAVRFAKRKKPLSAALTGLFWGAACNFRTTYQFGIIALLVGYTVAQVVKWIRKLVKQRKKDESSGERKILTKCLCGVLAVFMFIAISFPQFQINAAKGHMGILPYDHENAWVTIDQTRPASVMTFATNWAMEHYTSGAQPIVSDKLLQRIKSENYTMGETLTLPQILTIYAGNPLESLVTIGKRLFLAFDIKTSEPYAYPSEYDIHGSRVLIFSLLNYFVLAAALYALFCSKKCRVTEKTIAGLVFIGLGIPQLFVHIEWRYFMTMYILLYYFFSYHFVGDVLESREGSALLLKTDFIVHLVLFVFVAFTISLSIYA